MSHQSDIIYSRFIPEKQLSIIPSLNRTKKDFILLKETVSYCDDLSNFKIEFLTSFIGLTSLIIEKNSSMGYLFNKYLTDYYFKVAIFSTKLGEYPLMKCLVLYYKNRFYHLFSPLLIPNNNISEIFKDIIVPNSSFEIFSVISLFSYILCSVESQSEIKEISQIKKNQFESTIINMNHNVLWKLQFSLLESKNFKISIILI